ncbi:MAG: hypothetical protein Tsb0021_14710 [Chlamydiales bacterium]
MNLKQTSKRRIFVIDILSLLFCIWQSSGLIDVWDAHPHMKGGFLAFIIWLTPLGFYWSYPSLYTKEPSRLLLIAGVMVTTIGMLGSLNALRYLGLALAFIGMTPLSWVHLFWLISAFSWMSAMAYFLRFLTPQEVWAIRMVLSTSGAALTSLYFYYLLRSK